MPEGHTRLYRGDWAPGDNPIVLGSFLSSPEQREALASRMTLRNKNPRMVARNSVEGRWVTPDPKLAASYPIDKTDDDATLVNFVDVPNHVWEGIKGLQDQPTEVRHLSRMAEDEAIVPEEYKGKFTPSREHSSAKGLEILDNQDTYL